MIIDSHCHAWRQWPYQPPVPDPASRALVEQLLWEMDRSGVERAAVVCARIDHNPDNNDYIAECVARYPDRLLQLADVDCFWSATYQAPGAAERLAAAVARYRLIGFTHYVRADDDGGWYLSDEGLAFWEMAVRLRQIASLAVPARLQPVVRQVAARFPQLTLLCHHMAGVRLDAAGQASGLAEVLASAALPNIHIKLSGYHYVNPVAWDYPYPACRPIVAALYEAYGAERLHWGSDYPVVRPAMSYQQALEAVGSQADFIATAERQRILGDSLAALLVRR